MDKEPQANGNINPVAPVATNPNQEEEEEEFITPPDIAFFYDQLVEVAMGIIVDCKNVVETVDRINTVNDHDTSYIHEDSETKKENLGAAGKRVLGTAGLLMKNISKFVADNKDLYLEEKSYTTLFRTLEQSSRAVKECVVNLVRLATVSAFNTKAIASTGRTRATLESHCKSVASGIKKVLENAEELKVLQELEEEEWIKNEADEMAKSIASNIITLAKQCSIKLKEVSEVVKSNAKEPNEERGFVDTVKEASSSISKLGEFGANLGINDTEIKKSTISLIKTARQAWESKSDEDISELSSRQSALAQNISKMVLAAKNIDTAEMVRNHIFEDYFKREELLKSDPKGVSSTHRDDVKSSSNTPRDDAKSASSTPRDDTIKSSSSTPRDDTIRSSSNTPRDDTIRSTSSTPRDEAKSTSNTPRDEHKPANTILPLPSGPSSNSLHASDSKVAPLSKLGSSTNVIHHSKENNGLHTNGASNSGTPRSDNSNSATPRSDNSNSATPRSTAVATSPPTEIIGSTVGVNKIKQSMDEMKRKIDSAAKLPPVGGQPTPLLNREPRSPDAMRANLGKSVQIGNARPRASPKVDDKGRPISVRMPRQGPSLARVTSRKITKAPMNQQKANAAATPAAKQMEKAANEAKLASKYTSKDIEIITKYQRRVKKWYRIHKLRNVALEYLTSDASEKWRRRNMSLREIVSTERTYVTHLDELNNIIIEPLRETTHSFVSEKQIDELFSSLESIECLHVQFLQDMEDRMDQWPEQGKFADIFIKHSPVMNLYTEYINKYDRQVDLLAELESKKQWKDWIKSRKSKMTLGNYLILPVQRVTRYEMLLTNMLKLTPDDHVDYADIAQALASVQQLNVRADRRRAEDDNRKNIKAIQDSLTSTPQHFTLLVSQRILIREGMIDISFQPKKGPEKLQCYLFNDMFLFTSTKDKTTVGAPSIKSGTAGTGQQVIKERPKSKFKAVVYFKERCTAEKHTNAEFKLIDHANNITYICTTDNHPECDHWLKDTEEVLKEQAWKKILY